VNLAGVGVRLGGTTVPEPPSVPALIVILDAVIVAFADTEPLICRLLMIDA
jgi:hypothetical protein